MVLEHRDAWAYLLGIYLGDGYIDPMGRLRITCDALYPGIIDEVNAALRRVGVTRPWHVRGEGCWHVICGDYGWGEHFPTGRGHKHSYDLNLLPWHEHAIKERPHLVLRGLIQSDGCRFINRVARRAGGHYRYPTYDFCNTSAQIHDVYERCCDRMGLRPRPASSGRLRRINRRADVALLDLFIGPKR